MKKDKSEFPKAFVHLAQVFVLLATPTWYLMGNYDDRIEKEDTPTQELIKENTASIVSRAFIEPVAEPIISQQNTYKIPSNAPKRDIQQQIVDASAGSDIDSEYMLLLAVIESSLNPSAKAKKGTAAGAHQFIEQTWLENIRNHGGEYGLANEASMIKKGVKGNPHLLYLTDKTEQKRILDMRYDLTIATYMAIEFTKLNKKFLENVLKEEATQANLYALHFLGRRNASKFFKTLRKNPNWNPVDYFSKGAIKRNKGIFYFRDGKTARSFSQVHDYFQAKLNKAKTVITPPKPKVQAIAQNDVKML